jgi:hypothetical protein
MQFKEEFKMTEKPKSGRPLPDYYENRGKV